MTQHDASRQTAAKLRECAASIAAGRLDRVDRHFLEDAAKEIDMLKAGDDVAVGTKVLLGRAGVSMPGDWYVGTVLWARGDNYLIEHESNGETYLQIFGRDYIRCAGTLRELVAFKSTCREAVRRKAKAVHRKERELGEARDAVWSELDRLAAE